MQDTRRQSWLGVFKLLTMCLLGKAKSYSERLFAFYNIGPLDDEAATQALVLPAALLRLSIKAKSAWRLTIMGRQSDQTNVTAPFLWNAGAIGSSKKAARVDTYVPIV